MKKLCCIFNVPILYRELIFKRIEEAYDCDWYFEEVNGQFKTFDTNQFKKVTFLPTSKHPGFYTVKGLVSLVWHKDYSDYLMIGHTRNLSVFLFLLIKKLFFPSKKVYLWTHGYYGKESKVELLWKRTLYALADSLLLYGEYARELMLADGINPEKMHVLHNSLNYDEQLRLRHTTSSTRIYTCHFGNNYPVLLFIGRLTPTKRLDMLIDSLASLKQQGEHYNLVLVGDGSVRENLEHLAIEKGVSENVWFYGACFEESTNAELVYNADLCVSPGNVGLTAMHAMTFGTPVVSHNSFSLQMPEFEAIKEGITGAFYKHDDQDSLTDTISLWFKDHAAGRDAVRQACYHEIDTQWNPNFQMEVFKSVIK